MAKNHQNKQTETIAFVKHLEWILANPEHIGHIERYHGKINKNENAHQHWLTLRLIFPQTMEFLFLFLIATAMGLLFHLNQISGFPVWQLFPFSLLLLLLYKPIREWARSYPELAQAKQAWNKYQKILQEIATVPLKSPYQYGGNFIQIKNLSFSYPKSSPILNDLTLNLSPKSITGLQGPNGCGKTTLLRLLTRLEKPSTGLISLPKFWEDPQALPFYYMPQQFALNPRHLIKPFIENPNDISKRLCRILRLTPLLQSAFENGEKPPSSFSGGERQRFNLAQAFLSRASYLLLDEPSIWLPAKHRAQIFMDLFKLWQKEKERGLLIITHEPELLNLCHHIIQMEHL